MEGKLLWLLYNDVFTLRIPANHVVVFGTLEEGIELGEEGGLWLDVGLLLVFVVHGGGGRRARRLANEE